MLSSGELLNLMVKKFKNILKLYFMKKLYILLFTILISAVSFGQSDLIITGVFDGPLTQGTPKGVELYVLADITDLSIYGLGSANNGGGTDGEEFTFPADAATAGDFIYVASEAIEFNNFFGFASNYTSGAMAINGDDAIELFKDGSVVDLFGDINTDGTGQAWDHLDGWAYRNDETGPNTTFNVANWTFSGINVFDGKTSNADAAPNSFPNKSYTAPTASVVENQIEGFTLYPNPVTRGEFVITSNSNLEKNIEIYSVIGKQVYSKLVKSNEAIDISNLTAGFYMVRVEEEGKLATRKLIVR